MQGKKPFSYRCTRYSHTDGLRREVRHSASWLYPTNITASWYRRRVTWVGEANSARCSRAERKARSTGSAATRSSNCRS